ncbi:hypothetical protein EDD18DRAFT_1097743 [Armillaria luteobubalina]|uniref:Uncharacterized protein n=1 Tax=Armillaria luteobubalina TaxID=153913 RepID=A0AA39V0U7_9AGAR|nr:hypothetical protein EDD18DRAFT_1097743 [Armillaria luteobubalina]
MSRTLGAGEETIRKQVESEEMETMRRSLHDKSLSPFVPEIDSLLELDVERMRQNTREEEGIQGAHDNERDREYDEERWIFLIFPSVSSLISFKPILAHCEVIAPRTGTIFPALVAWTMRLMQISRRGWKERVDEHVQPERRGALNKLKTVAVMVNAGTRRNLKLRNVYVLLSSNAIAMGNLKSTATLCGSNGARIYKTARTPSHTPANLPLLHPGLRDNIAAIQTDVSLATMVYAWKKKEC